MKKYIKDIFPAFVISLVGSFMLYINEPIMMLAGNVNDFWFDLKFLLKFTSIAFGILFAIVFVAFNIVYFISLLLKKKNIYRATYLIAFALFICTYIQGNYLVGSLPVLDGTPISWDGFTTQKIISVVLLVLSFVVSILLSIKFSLKNFCKYSNYVVMAIFVMLGTSLFTTVLTTEGLDDKELITSSTFKDYHTYSKDNNFIIILLDAVDSQNFANQLNKKYNGTNILENFTYYPDTISGHPFTHESILYALSGQRFENQGDLSKFSTKSLKESPLFENLYSKNYDVNVYTRDIVFNDEDALKLNNYITVSNVDGVDYKHYIKQETKYVLFRYLPFYLKKLSIVDTMKFDLPSFDDSEIEYYYESNDIFNNVSANNLIEYSDNKQFKFFHLDGAHVPFSFDRTLEYKEDATYQDELDGCITMVNNYLNYLKENNIYDNSSIIIMSDHGFNVNYSAEGRQNPIFFIKGVNEKHEYKVSDLPISYSDLMKIYDELIDQKKTNEMFSYIDKDRERTYIQYSADGRDTMTEYGTKDKAWEFDKYYETGNVYKAK